MRRLLALFLLAATAATHPVAPARPDGLTADSEARWIPFDLTPGNQIRFSLLLDGAPVDAVLDTGVSQSVVSRAWVDAHKIRLRGGGSAAAIGGSIATGTIDARSIAMGGLYRGNVALSVASLPATATGSTRPIAMLVGRDLVADYALDLDFDAHRFRLLPSGRMPFTGATAPLAISPARQVYVSELIMGGARVSPLIVDTGDGASITLSDRAWQFVKPAAPLETTALAYGLGGPIVMGLAIVPRVVSGAQIASAVEVRIEPKGGFSDSVGMAGRIGTGFLERYRVLLDPRAGRMILKPGNRADEDPQRSTSGLLLAPEADRLRVVHVMRGGPGASAGWQAGDTICSVDGTAIGPDYAGSPLAGWSTGTPGRTVTLGLCDGSVRQLTLQQFY
jgi:hypothetical protein